jgi:hypothetical protein
MIGPQAHEALRESFDPQPPGERCDEHDPGIGNHPLVIKDDLHNVQSDQPVIVHHEGDLLRGPRLRLQPGKALLRRSFFLQHRTTPTKTCGGSRLSAEALAQAAAGRLVATVGQTFALRQAAQAHAAIESRATIGKTLLLT